MLKMPLAAVPNMKESIKLLIIDSLNPGPHVLIVAGVHGDEYEPMMAAWELYHSLHNKLSIGKVTIVPIVNKSSYENNSRLGTDDLDLARTCPGKANGTPTEIAADAVSRLIGTADYFVDMHTGGLAFDIIPLAGYALVKDEKTLEKQKQMAACFNMPFIWGTDATMQGRTLSVARDAHVPGIYLEYGGGTAIRKEVIEKYKNGCINMLRYLKMTAGVCSLEKGSGTYWLEDATPDSGHLQTKMPSPIAGVFVSDVKIGDIVNKGQSFGKILNPQSGESTAVYAGIDGLVILLRILVKVNKGDTLGHIVPIYEQGMKIIK
ncbi:MAG: succinylglutamate desuccinylase/aspartoacylase family protein [Ginsengibacter sp.]